MESSRKEEDHEADQAAAVAALLQAPDV